jgi:hypothetical protein
MKMMCRAEVLVTTVATNGELFMLISSAIRPSVSTVVGLKVVIVTYRDIQGRVDGHCGHWNRNPLTVEPCCGFTENACRPPRQSNAQNRRGLIRVNSRRNGADQRYDRRLAGAGWPGDDCEPPLEGCASVSKRKAALGQG